MGREMGCRGVGGDGWVEGRSRGIARQAFRSRILSYTAPTRCPSCMHTYDHVCPSIFQHRCVYTHLQYMTQKNPEKLPHFSDSPPLLVRAHAHSSTQPPTPSCLILPQCPTSPSNTPLITYSLYHKTQEIIQLVRGAHAASNLLPPVPARSDFSETLNISI